MHTVRYFSPVLKIIWEGRVGKWGGGNVLRRWWLLCFLDLSIYSSVWAMVCILMCLCVYVWERISVGVIIFIISFYCHSEPWSYNPGLILDFIKRQSPALQHEVVETQSLCFRHNPGVRTSVFSTQMCFHTRFSSQATKPYVTGLVKIQGETLNA